MDLPSDLVTLPTTPYKERPAALPLEVEECRTAVWLAAGNIKEAAGLLKVPSARLRNFIKGSPYLQAEVQESKEIMVDIAESNVVEALSDKDDVGRRDSMTRFVLQSQGRSRGWGTGANSGLNINAGGAKGRVVISWENGDSFEPEEPRVINAQAGK
jgi:hypothetical protein